MFDDSLYYQVKEHTRNCGEISEKLKSKNSLCDAFLPRSVTKNLELNHFCVFLFWRNREREIEKVFLLEFVTFIRLEIEQIF